jgi:ornithine cyclodeaminase/alanine dehydrogenase-like protein (mu-crystallin family)
VFVVVDAVTGAPLGIFQENRFMTDLRTGAAGGVSVSPWMDVLVGRRVCTSESSEP